MLLLLTLLPTVWAAASGFNFVKSGDSTSDDTKATASATATVTATPMPANFMEAPVSSVIVDGGSSTAGGQASSSTTGQTTPVTGDPAYGRTNVKGVNIRASASGDSAIVERVARTGTVFEILRETENVQGEKWYVISLGGIKEGFIRPDLVEVITEQDYNDARYSVVARAKKTTAKKSSSSKATVAPTAAPTTSGVIIVTASPTVSVDPNATPTAAPSNDQVVYAAAAGSTYHKTESCGGVTYTLALRLSVAQSNGLNKCPSCW